MRHGSWQFRVRDPELFLSSLLLSSTHSHARILRTSAVDRTVFFLRNPDLHHGLLVQENHPYNHGETSAIRDAGRKDFSLTTIFTTLSPCDVCAALIYMRQFNRVVIGDVTNASGNEQLIRDKGVQVDILEDQKGIALYAKYRREKPDQDNEDWKGLAEVRRHPSTP
jgi:tRNA(Arg) A34 adenosine deaminase TadA